MSKSLKDEIASLVADTVQKDGIDPDADAFDDGPRYEQDYDEDMDVGRGDLRTRSQAPELDDEYGGKEVSREEVDDWIGGFDSEGSYDEEEGGGFSGDEDEDENEMEDEEGLDDEEGSGKKLKTRNASEAERLHQELLSADKHKSRAKQTIDILGRDSTITDAEKSEHARNQTKLWDAVMESRIRMQQVLVLANRLPQPESYALFVEDQSTKKSFEDVGRACQGLLREFDDMIVAQWNKNDEIVASCGSTESIPRSGAPDTEALWKAISARTAAFKKYQNDVLDKWFQRTQIGFTATKKFKAVNQGIVQQVEQILQDRPRLLKRARTHRSAGRVLGQPEAKRANSEGMTEEEAERQQKEKNEGEIDPEIYDDTDFYGELLRELIEANQRSAADGNNGDDDDLAMTELNKLRNSTRKKRRDKQLSKGRKIRFDVIPELVNFMAPTGTDELQAKAAEWDTAQLFANLFGSASNISS